MAGLPISHRPRIVPTKQTGRLPVFKGEARRTGGNPPSDYDLSPFLLGALPWRAARPPTPRMLFPRQKRRRSPPDSPEKGAKRRPSDGRVAAIESGQNLAPLPPPERRPVGYSEPTSAGLGQQPGAFSPSLSPRTQRPRLSRHLPQRAGGTARKRSLGRGYFAGGEPDGGAGEKARKRARPLTALLP